MIGVPIDFRLGFGGSFGEETKLIRLDVAPNALTANRLPEVDLVGDVARDAWRRCARRPATAGRAPRLARAAARRSRARSAPASRRELDDGRSPLHPVRVYSELGEVLDRDAIVDRRRRRLRLLRRALHRHLPAGLLDGPGPFGCLGAGPGQAIGAKLAHPERQVCLLLGDGAFGFAGMEFDTMARHGLGVVGVMGNNGIWALEHHPMKFLYGYSVAAELQAGDAATTRWSRRSAATGSSSASRSELRPALERAFESGRPTLVNVLTDPEVVYPRKSNLA